MFVDFIDFFPFVLLFADCGPVSLYIVLFISFFSSAYFIEIIDFCFFVGSCYAYILSVLLL